MDALTFWKTTTMDKANLLEGLIDLLNQHGIGYCVIDGQAVNAYPALTHLVPPEIQARLV